MYRHNYAHIPGTKCRQKLVVRCHRCILYSDIHYTYMHFKMMYAACHITNFNCMLQSHFNTDTCNTELYIVRCIMPNVRHLGTHTITGADPENFSWGGVQP